MSRYFTKEVKIALVAIVGIIVLFTGMNFLKGIIVLSDDPQYKVIVDDVKGLSASSPVYADGYKVGVVRGIDYDYDGANGGIVVNVQLDDRLRVPAGSTAEIVSDLMGNVKMNILLTNNMRERIEPGGVIRGANPKEMMDQVAQMLPYVQQMLPKVDSILSSVNQLLADPALRNTLHNAEAITSNLRTTTDNLNALTANMNRTVPGMLVKADNTLSNTETLTNNLAQIDVQTTMSEINATLRNVHALTNKLNSTEGTVGKFLNDPTLYNNLNATVRDADSLVIDLKTNPKRYVHFSVFGKK